MMDWLAFAILTALLTGLALAVIRSVRRGRHRWLVYFIPIVVTVLAVRWAAYRQTWPELAVAACASAALCIVWWIAYGRRLPPPTDDNIRVWTKEDPF
jgi:hypothetical protein